MTNLHLIIEPPSGGRYEHRLVPGSYVLGRQEGSADVVIPSPEVSRQHLRLTLTETQCTAEDLGSTSGTTHQGQAVTGSVTLSYPVELHLGTVKVRVEAVTQSAEQGGAAGHYTKGKAIAQGGMGAVLEANDQLLGRTVAMKVVRHDIGDSESIRLRFIREATVLARLEHPSIVPIYEMGRDSEGRLFYTMKKVEGRTLQGILDDLKKGKPETVKEYTLDRLLNVFRKICDAMAFAHDRGVIHRDLKPENVMVGEYGEVLVMDWGLAKILQDAAQSAAELQLSTQVPGSASGTQIPTGFQELSDSQLSGSSQNLTLDGAVMGSPQYMPPEQAEGKVGEIDERSDIFSLGGILYSILTLKPPVEGRTIKEVLDNVKSGKITPPTHFTTGSSSNNSTKLPKGNDKDPKLIISLPHCPGGRVPSSLSSVTMKAMAFAPESRYAAVGELSADVENHQGGFATSAENLSAAGQFGLFIKRHKGVSIASLVATAVLLAVSVVFVVNLNASRETAIKQRDEAERLQKVTRSALARASLSLGEAALSDADSLGIQSALAEVPGDLRDSTWKYLMHVSDSSVARIRTSTDKVEDVAAIRSRPGVFAVADAAHKVSLIDIRAGKTLIEFDIGFDNQPGRGTRRIAVSPDGNLIAVGRNGPGGIAIHDAHTGAKVRGWDTTPTHYLEFGSMNRIIQGDLGTLNVWDASLGRKLWDRTSKQAGGLLYGAFTPDGNHVITHATKTQLQRVDAGTGEVLQNIGGRSGAYMWAMAVRPDGKAVFTWDSSGLTYCVSLETGKRLFELAEKKSRQWMGFSADGAQLVTVAKQNDGAQSIEVWNAHTGVFLRSILGGSGDPTGIAVHPLSCELAIAGPSARAWDLSGPPERWQFQVNSVPHTSTLSFWGSDDVFFGMPSNSDDWGLYQRAAGKPSLLWKPEKKANRVSDVSRNGRIAALSHPGFDTRTIVLEHNGSQIARTNEFNVGFWPYRLRLSPSGKQLLLLERPHAPQLLVMDTDSGKRAFTPDQKEIHGFNDMEWIDDAHLAGVVTYGDKRGNPGSVEKLVVWSAADGSIIKSVTHGTAMDVLVVSPDGSQLAEAGFDRNIRIRDAKSLDIIHEFRAHDGGITSLAWHPRLPVMATASIDLSVKLWKLDSAENIQSFRAMPAAPSDLVFSPGGQFLAAAYRENATGRVWELDGKSATSIWSWQNAIHKNRQFKPEDIIGRYTQDVIENNWHAGNIREAVGKPGQLEWKNDAGVVWGLTIMSDGILETDSRNPYRESYSRFILKFDDSETGEIHGFRFQSGYFKRRN